MYSKLYVPSPRSVTFASILTFGSSTFVRDAVKFSPPAPGFPNLSYDCTINFAAVPATAEVAPNPEMLAFAGSEVAI